MGRGWLITELKKVFQNIELPSSALALIYSALANEIPAQKRG